MSHSFAKDVADSGTISIARAEAERIARTMYRYDNIAEERVNGPEAIGPEQVRRFKELGKWLDAEGAIRRLELGEGGGIQYYQVKKIIEQKREQAANQHLRK